MASPAVELLRDPDRVRVALTPIRRELLEQLRTPASATMLAERLGQPRQRLNYHLRVLEEAGLVTLVEERQRRGFVERVLVARATSYLVDPSVIRKRSEVLQTEQDAFAADHLLDAAAEVVEDVGRMQEAAREGGKRLLTFTIEAEIVLGQPGDFTRFAERLSEAIAGVAGEFNAPRGRRYRVMLGALPATDTRESASFAEENKA